MRTNSYQIHFETPLSFFSTARIRKTITCGGVKFLTRSRIVCSDENIVICFDIFLRQYDSNFHDSNLWKSKYFNDKIYRISELIEERDKKLFRKIANDPEHILYDLLPEKRYRSFRQWEHILLFFSNQFIYYHVTLQDSCIFVRTHVCRDCNFNKDL